MKRKLVALLLVASTVLSIRSEACTNILISKGASTDGSAMVTYAADSHQLFGCLYFRPAEVNPKGTMIPVYEWDTGKYLGEIEQAEQTYAVVGNMNEHQLIIAESTYGGRGLGDTTGIMDYGTLIYNTLQRAKTAREAIHVIDSMTTKYGYYSSGESFSIADPNEVWHMELIGKGTKIVDGENVNRGIVWVAKRVPDGYIGMHANHARITTIDFDDPVNCLYAEDVISFAKEEGFFKGSDEKFSFSAAYDPATFTGLRMCEARVWSIFNKISEEGAMDQYLDYAMGYDASTPMPLFIKPTQQVSVKDVLWMMRDHYEDTPMDPRYDIGSGGNGCPYRWRQASFEVDGQRYVHERPLATQQTGFWFVAQARDWLPDEVGGLIWFAVDDAGTSCATPIYASSTAVPLSLSEENGSMLEYSPTSAFWLNNRVANAAYLRYDAMSADIHKVINEIEDRTIAEIPAIDGVATLLNMESPDLARTFLTNYSATTAQLLFDRWVDLSNYLLVKYMDGNVKKEKDGQFEENGYGMKVPASPEFPGYSDTWKRAVAESTGERLKVVEPKNVK